MDRVRTYPTFAADGTPLRRHSFEAALRLEREDKVRVQRRNDGEILSVRYLKGARSSQLRLTVRLQMGTKYSYQENLGDTGRTWTLKPLPRKPPDMIESYVQAIFQAVPLSIIQKTEPVNQKRTDNVIPIDAGRKVQKTQPVSVTGTPLAA